MKNKLFILFILISLCSTSCIDEIDTRLGNEKSTLVLESFLSPMSTVNAASLSTSIVVNSRNQAFGFPEDATVILEEVSTGNQSILNYLPTGEYASDDLIIKEGEMYTLSASVPDEEYDISFGSTTIPTAIEILDVELLEKIEEMRPNGKQGIKYSFAITIEESSASPGYFHLFPFAEVKGINPETLDTIPSRGFESFEDYDFSLGGGNACHDIEHLGGILINQSKLQNNQFFVSFYTNPSFLLEDQFIDDVIFELRTIEESYYNYHLASSKQIRVLENSGGQLVASYTNITNGFGVVSSYSPSIVPISVK